MNDVGRRLGSKLNNPRVSGELSNAAIKMSEGEMMEIKLSKDAGIREDDYIKVLEYKGRSESFDQHIKSTLLFGSPFPRLILLRQVCKGFGDSGEISNKTLVKIGEINKTSDCSKVFGSSPFSY